ncbi:MAG: hypothetical protein V4624_07985 [Pseudomonadota bacterium]
MNISRLLLLLISLSWLGCTPGHAADDAPPQITRIDIPAQIISEASALVRSHRNPEILWTLNDSGSGPDIYALSTNGGLLGSATLTGPGIINQDWEDMASFTREQKHFLLIGDVGDNFAWRPNITLYLIEEPVLPAPADTATAPVLHTFRVELPNGPRDIEAIAVDPDENAAYLISKRDNRPTLYRFSLAHAETEQVTTLIASDLGEINIPRGERNNHYINWVTAMDFSESGRWAYVGTLSHGYRYARESGESWQTALLKAPQGFLQPKLRQIEGGCFDLQDDQQLFVISETLPAKMARIRWSSP